jgi:hypothetical protein
MKIIRVVALLIVFVFFASFVADTKASEGNVNLLSITNDKYRCYAASLLMSSNKYKILVGCRDLLFPPDENLFTYVMWATPVSGSKPIKLGSIGGGRAEFSTKTAFSNLFVTMEQSSKVRVPGGVVMRGNVESITILETRPENTPTPSDEKIDGDEDETKNGEEPQDKTQNLSTRDRLVLGLKRAGLVSFLALIALVGLIFVVSRSRG